jgi:hypothetical protein
MNSNAELKPALASINESCKYMGISRAKFYADILPHVDSMYFGKRHLVVIASMDRLIAANSRKAVVEETTISSPGKAAT